MVESQMQIRKPVPGIDDGLDPQVVDRFDKVFLCPVVADGDPLNDRSLQEKRTDGSRQLTPSRTPIMDIRPPGVTAASAFAR